MIELCIVANTLVAVGALVLVWRKLPPSDTDMVKVNTRTAIAAFNAGLNSAVKEKRAKIEMEEMNIHKAFQVPAEPRADDRAEGEVDLDDGDTG